MTNNFIDEQRAVSLLQRQPSTLRKYLREGKLKGEKQKGRYMYDNDSVNQLLRIQFIKILGNTNGIIFRRPFNREDLKTAIRLNNFVNKTKHNQYVYIVYFYDDNKRDYQIIVDNELDQIKQSGRIATFNLTDFLLNNRNTVKLADVYQHLDIIEPRYAVYPIKTYLNKNAIERFKEEITTDFNLNAQKIERALSIRTLNYYQFKDKTLEKVKIGFFIDPTKEQKQSLIKNASCIMNFPENIKQVEQNKNWKFIEVKELNKSIKELNLILGRKRSNGNRMFNYERFQDIFWNAYLDYYTPITYN